MKVYAMLFKGKKHRALRIILSVVCVLILICILLDFSLPSFHSEIHRGIDYYSDNSYKRLGYGFNRYGRIASKYLPSYDEVLKDAEYIDFAYVDANHYVVRNVAVCVGARYPEEIYTQKRDELLKQGGESPEIRGTVCYRDTRGQGRWRRLWNYRARAGQGRTELEGQQHSGAQ